MSFKFLRLFATTAIGAVVLLAGADLRAQPAPPASLLRDAYDTLTMADHDCRGHRAAAMKEIEAAAKYFRVDVRGDGRAHEKQGASDDQLRAARGTLVQVRGELRGKPLTHVNRAIHQIDVALQIK